MAAIRKVLFEQNSEELLLNVVLIIILNTTFSSNFPCKERTYAFFYNS